MKYLLFSIACTFGLFKLCAQMPSKPMPYETWDTTFKPKRRTVPPTITPKFELDPSFKLDPIVKFDTSKLKVDKKVYILKQEQINK